MTGNTIDGNASTPEDELRLSGYDGEQIVEERDATGVVKASYVNGRYVDEILSMTRTQLGQTRTHYFHQDEQYNTLQASYTSTRSEW